jgi:ribose/xylose/arabinose/galactoside ABC-type transport system permease subunit
MAIDEIGVIGALVAICVFLTITSDKFLTRTSFINVSRQASYVAIMALGMVFVISTGDIDPSVGSMLMLSSVSMAILILNDPTRSVDVVAKSEIYQLCGQLAKEGLAFLFTSSEVEETLGVCNRVLVLYKGRVVREFARGEATKADVMYCVAGGGAEAGEAA